MKTKYLVALIIWAVMIGVLFFLESILAQASFNTKVVIVCSIIFVGPMGAAYAVHLGEKAKKSQPTTTEQPSDETEQ